MKQASHMQSCCLDFAQIFDRLMLGNCERPALIPLENVQRDDRGCTNGQNINDFVRQRTVRQANQPDGAPLLAPLSMTFL